MPNAPSTLRILIVDDERLIRWSLAETLSAAGYDVVETGDGHSAVAAVKAAAAPFDVALLGFRMPDSNDLELMARLRRLAPSMKMILMTAFGAPEILRRALDLGAFCVISKPFEMSQVAPLVCQAHASRF